MHLTVFPGNEAISVALGDLGGKVSNTGSVTVYYQDSPGVSSSSYEGVIAAGSSAQLYGTQYFVVDRGASGRADLEVTKAAADVVTHPASKLDVSGRQAFTDEIGAGLMVRPPIVTWSAATSFASNFSGSSLTSPLWVPWSDSRIKWIGGTPVAYTSAGYGTNLGGVARVKYDGNLSTYRVLSIGCFRHTGSAFELIARVDPGSSYQLRVNGRMTTADPVVVVPPAGGTTGELRLIRHEFEARATRDIKVEGEALLTGGILVGSGDLVTASPGVMV